MMNTWTFNDQEKVIVKGIPLEIIERLKQAGGVVSNDLATDEFTIYDTELANVSWAGDEELSGLYRYICGRFNELCAFEEKGRSAVKMLACFKYALELDGVISNSSVCKGTPPLTDEQKKIFSDAYHSFSEERNRRLPERWRTRVKVKV